MEAGARLCFWKLWHLHLEQWRGDKTIYISQRAPAAHVFVACRGGGLDGWALQENQAQDSLQTISFLFFLVNEHIFSYQRIMHQIKATAVHVLHHNKAQWMQSDATVLEAARFCILYFLLLKQPSWLTLKVENNQGEKNTSEDVCNLDSASITVPEVRPCLHLIMLACI